MPRSARSVIPQVPHHITHRSFEQKPIFRTRKELLQYKMLMQKYSVRFGVTILAYCIMHNHVHIVAVPAYENSLGLFMNNVQRDYSKFLNNEGGKNKKVRGARFYSIPLDEKHLMYAVRYVEQNPVRAGIVQYAEDYEFSSARAHLRLVEDETVDVKPVLRVNPDWLAVLRESLPEQDELVRSSTIRSRSLFKRSSRKSC